jgi:MFS family permease
MISVVQELTPGHLQGRLMGAIESLSAVTLAVGLALGGALVAITGARWSFVIVGAGTTLMTAVLAPVSVLSLAHARRRRRVSTAADGSAA